MIEQTYTVLNPVGIHARPANAIMETANSFTSKVTLRTDAKTANAKSIVSILKLGLKAGDQVTVSATGEDEELAVRAVGEIIRSIMD